MPQILPKFHRIAFAAPALVLAMSASAAPPPLDAMDAAHVAVNAATTPVSNRFAPQELGNAHQRLDAAEAAMTKRDYKQARVLADEARANADLTRAKAQALSARAAIDVRTQENAELQHRLLDQQPLGAGEINSVPRPMDSMPAQTPSDLAPSGRPSFPPPQPDDGFQPMAPTGSAASTDPMDDGNMDADPSQTPAGGFAPVAPNPMPDQMTPNARGFDGMQPLPDDTGAPPSDPNDEDPLQARHPESQR